MNAAGKCLEVNINRTDDNTRVIWLLLVQLNEVFSIEGHEDALVFTREVQHHFIGNALSGVARVKRGQHVMSVLT